MTTPLNPEVVKALGRGDLPPYVANILRNDPYANLEATVNHAIAQSRQFRADRERLRSTLHSCKEEYYICKTLHFLRDLFRPMTNLLFSIGRSFASFFKEKDS